MFIFFDLLIGLSLFMLFLAIVINFAEAKGQKVKKSIRSRVETGTMTLFFIIFYLIIRFKLGICKLPLSIHLPLAIVGVILVVAGALLNIYGRLKLGKNWANQVKVYDNQTFVRSGIYAVVRHPLYGSLIMMFYGAVLVHPNYIAFLANSFIFIPFIYYRARQEEELLLQEFTDYKIYRQQVGMFFPRILNYFTIRHGGDKQ